MNHITGKMLVNGEKATLLKYKRSVTQALHFSQKAPKTAEITEKRDERPTRPFVSDMKKKRQPYRKSRF